MKYMLDTNICIYAIKNKPECVFWHISDNIKKGLCISVITFAELQYGIAKSNYPEKNAKSLSKHGIKAYNSYTLYTPSQ